LILALAFISITANQDDYKQKGHSSHHHSQNKDDYHGDKDDSSHHSHNKNKHYGDNDDYEEEYHDDDNDYDEYGSGKGNDDDDYGSRKENDDDDDDYGSGNSYQHHDDDDDGHQREDEDESYGDDAYGTSKHGDSDDCNNKGDQDAPICSSLSWSSNLVGGSCYRYVKGYDVTGVTNEVDLAFPEIVTVCDCIRQCLINNQHVPIGSGNSRLRVHTAVVRSILILIFRRR